MVVAILEDVVTERVHALLHFAVLLLHLADIVGVVIVEGINAAIRRLQKHGVAGLRSAGGFDVHRRFPGAAAIRAAHRDDVLPALTFVTGARGHHAEPSAIIRLHDVWLIGVTFAGDVPAVTDVARVRNGDRRCVLPGLLRAIGNKGCGD